MKILFKRLIYIIFIIIIFFNSLQPILSIGASSQFTNYVAMGDSIAYGYGLKDISTQSYAQIVRSKLNIPKTNFKNLAISGMTCKEYYEKITTDSSYQNSIKSADLITVSIGSNELLGIAINAVAKVTGISSKEPDFENKAKQAFLNANILQQAKMLREIYSFFTSNETKQKINDSISTYSEYWDKSYKYIKSINPNASIIATQFYNPYYEISLLNYDLGGFVDEPITKLNEILMQKSNSEKNYKIAKIYNDFNTTNPRITNVEISLSEKKFNIDPHPNKSGHQKISTRVLDAISTIPNKKNISTLNIAELPDMTYTGNELTPNVIIKDGKTTLKENKDYTITYINNVNIGEAKVDITGIGNYSGNVIKTFNIKNAPKQDIKNAKISEINQQTYTGFKITPIVNLSFNNVELKQNQDYILTYQNNINVGNANIIIKGIGNYSGTLTKSFTISPKNIAETYISNIEKQQHNGKEINPTIQISDGSSKLELDKDYTVSYKNNINVGTAKVTITGLNNYTGQLEKEFEIVESSTNTRKDLSVISCTQIQDKIYTGKLITPEVVLKDNDYTLIKGTDYELAYTNNLNIGKATLTITGLGNYSGMILREFNIIKKDINYTLIDDISDQEYNGKEIKPTITITSDFIKLKENEDYTIEYSNNIQVGTATITITGINNYTGKLIKTFNIIELSSNNNSNTENTNTINNSDIGINTEPNVNINNNIENNNSNSNKLILPYTGINNILVITIISLSIFITINIIQYRKNNY